MKCKYCGTKLVKGIEVCQNCGAVNKKKGNKNIVKIVVAAVLVAIIAVAVVFTVPSKYERLLEDASSAFYDNKYKETVTLCTEAIAEKEDSQDAYYLRGQAYYEQKEYELAVKDFEKVLDLGGEYVYKELWQACEKAKDTSSAEKYMKAQLKCDEYDVETYIALVNLYEKKGKYKEARELKAEGFRITGDSRLEIVALTEAEAKEIGGLYILSGNNFYMLDIVGHQASQYDRNDYKFNLEEYENIPVLCEGDKLVFFSKNSLEESYPLYKVVRRGYTIPTHFSDPDFFNSANAYGHVMNFKEYDYNEGKVVSYDDYGENYRIENIESINGGSFRSFYEKNVPVEEVAELEKGEKVTFAYHDGSEYVEYTETAEMIYYLLGDELSIKGSVSKKSYAVLDTSNLSEGTYIIPFEMSEKMIMYFSNKLNFIFKVGK